ncbi:MAG: hypothetical protein NC432_05310 [Roseburia sp.]|nr:hypothetical protein [Roseburia sp.]MCM1097926.1 hypothetical protein [Ruminococcus flavefaciens]
MIQEDGTLYVQMFNGFAMFWNGELVTGSAKSSESQFMYLMQLLLHNRRDGVRREELEQVLFQDRDIADTRHALRSVIYNARKRLLQAGLPEGEYVVQKKGVYYWGAPVPVREDAEEFEEAYKAAETSDDNDEKLRLYLKACYSYTGDFLANQAAVLWVAQEANRYRKIFSACVERAAVLLRENEEFRQMKELGIRASKINPLSDWETVTMEALIAMGQYEEAQKLYSDTVELYFREQGLRPSGKMTKFFNELGSQMNQRYDTLDNIQENLEQGMGDGQGGYVCPYPVFVGIYHMMMHMMDRGGQSVFLMLCRIVDSKGNPMKEGNSLDELTERLGEAIKQSTRRSDVITKHGKGQYLVILLNTTRENCDIVKKRINWRFMVGRQRTGVQYYVNSVFSTPRSAEDVFEAEKKKKNG